MENLEEIAKNPAYALGAMVHGLRNPQGLEIDMGTFGSVDEIDADNRVCFGCASTCALQEITGQYLVNYIEREMDSCVYDHEEDGDEFDYDASVEMALNGAVYDVSTNRRAIYDVCGNALDELELAIDRARKGDLARLFKFFGLWELFIYAYHVLPVLKSDSYIEHLAAYDSVIERMHTDNPGWDRFRAA